MTKEQVLAIIQRRIDRHDEMSSWLMGEGQAERAKAWVAGSVALGELLDELKGLEW